MLDDIAQAVLAREEVVKYLRGGDGERGDQARARIYGYIEELRTTQRPSMYRALQHPLYPILRKIDREHENLHHAANAVRDHRVVYASNHKSHTDYLVEPLVLDDNGIPLDAGLQRLFPNRTAHNPADLAAARAVASREDVYPVGLLYRDENAARYDLQTQQGLGRSQAEKIAATEKWLSKYEL